MSSLATISSCGPLRTTAACISNDREFLLLEKDWNRLLMESLRPVPFLTWEWISTWWRFFKKHSTLFVSVAKDGNGRVIGIAPLHVVIRKAFGLVPVRSVEFLGYRGSKVCADHLDFLTERENREAIASRLLDEILARRDQWDTLVLADIAEESMVPDLLARMTCDSGIQPECRPEQMCPYVNLPSSWEILLGSMKAKHRSNVKRRRDKLYKDFRVRFDWNCAPDRVVPHMEVLEKLHGSARNRKGESGNFHVEQYREFHRAVAERMARSGHLYFARLDCNDVAVAALYGYFIGGRLFGYQTGFDSSWADRGVGVVLQATVFEDAIGRLHASEYDFLRGTEAYKYTWASHERLTRTVLQWNTSMNARMANTELSAKRRVAALRSRLRM